VLNSEHGNWALNRDVKEILTEKKYMFRHLLTKLGCESVDWFYLTMKEDGGEFLDYLRDYHILKKG
jgi:hypothetical protein